MAASAVPRFPPAPGLFSTTIGRPRMAAILLKRTRLTTSLALPPANGMITVIARFGKPCALAVSATKAVVAHNAIATDVLNFMFLPDVTRSSPLYGCPFAVRSDTFPQFDLGVVTVKLLLFRRKRRRLRDPVRSHPIVARPDRRNVGHLIKLFLAPG